MPIRTGNSSSRCAATAASTADLGEAKAAHTPSPVCLNNQPPCASITLRNTSSWTASANRMAPASASHRRVEPSTSVNKNVTTPEGAAAGGADTPAESHTRQAPTSHIAGIRSRNRRPEARRSASRWPDRSGDIAHAGWPPGRPSKSRVTPAAVGGRGFEPPHRVTARPARTAPAVRPAPALPSRWAFLLPGGASANNGNDLSSYDAAAAPARQLLTVPSPVVALPVPPLAVGQPPPLPPCCWVLAPPELPPALGPGRRSRC